MSVVPAPGPRYRIVEVEPLGTGVVLPAVVIGYEIESSRDLAPKLREVVPPWIWLVAQQAGGQSMRYPTVLGLVLRLAGNTDRTPNLVRLDLALRAMAEDPDVALLRRKYPVLADLVLTDGSDYDRAALDRLERFLAGFARFPRLASGFEAFLRLASCDLLDSFGGWKLLEHRAAIDSLTSSYDIDDGILRRESGLAALDLADGAPFAPPHLDRLAAVAAGAGLQGEPAGFLLWENSD